MNILILGLIVSLLSGILYLGIPRGMTTAEAERRALEIYNGMRARKNGIEFTPEEQEALLALKPHLFTGRQYVRNPRCKTQYLIISNTIRGGMFAMPVAIEENNG
jgi:hypothetical protein